jgi:hypothetical protein
VLYYLLLVEKTPLARQLELKKNIGVVFSQKKTRTRGGRYCKTRDRTELKADRQIHVDR